MITAILGKPGSGKSLQMVRLCEKFLRQGRDVYSNIIIDERKMNLGKKKGTLYRWHDLGSFKHIHKGVVLWDEIGAYFDSRGYASFPPDVRTKFQQYRKDGLDIFYTSQAWSRVDLIIRQVTNMILECNAFVPFFRVTEWWPEEYEKPAGVPRKHRGWFFYIGYSKLYSKYDTYQSIIRKNIINFKFDLMIDIIKDIETKGGDKNWKTLP